MAVKDWPKEFQHRPWKPTGDTRCQICGCVIVCWWIESVVWNLVMGNESGNLCPSCFVRRADECGVGRSGAWQLYPPGQLK